MSDSVPLKSLAKKMKSSPSSSEGALTSLRLDLPLNRRGPSSGFNGPGAQTHSGLGAAGYPEPHPIPASPSRTGTLGGGGGSAGQPAEGERKSASGMDEFLMHLGNPGRFQVVVMILLSTNLIPVVVNHLLMAFYAVSAPHNCRVPDNFFGNKSSLLPHKEVEEGMSLRRFYRGEDPIVYEECEMYLHGDNHSLGRQPCIHGYEFHFEEDKEWNVIAEWGLVCDRAFVAPLITTIYFCGVMIGGVLFGSLSDRFGRKNMMLICLYTQCLIGIAIHFVRRLIMFMGLRFIQGIFVQGLQCVTYTMVMELFSNEYRTLAGCVVEAFWAMGIILLALIAKYVQHWRYIQLAINIPTLATIFYIWIIPESVRWLLSRGKLKRAEEVVIRIASYNSLRLDRGWVREELDEVSRMMLLHTPERSPDLRDIIVNSRIRKNSFIMFFVWFSVSLSYYGISFSIPNLSGDRYLNFMIGGGIELGAYLLAYVVLSGFGRRYPLAIYLMLSGLLCIGIVAIQKYLPPSYIDIPALVIGLALIGKAAAVSCFCSIFIYSSEIFPTVIRTAGVGSCVFFGRLGSLTAPQILLLGQYLYAEGPELVAFMTFGVLSIISSFLTLFLPETLNKSLPDTVQQANHLGQGGGRRRSLRQQKRKGSHMLLRNDQRSGAGGSSDSLHQQDEAGYGKSPEWVEVDGMIVSRGILESRNSTLIRPNHRPHHGGISTLDKSTLGGGSNSSNSNTMNTTANGSVLSLPYSNRTLLTNSSNRSTNINNSFKIEEEENPYETLPNMDDEPSDEEGVGIRNHHPPPRVMPRFFHPQKQQQPGEGLQTPPHHQVQFHNNPNSGGGGGGLTEEPQTDDSVISAHHSGSMAIYDFIKDPPLLPPNPLNTYHQNNNLDNSSMDYRAGGGFLHHRGSSSSSAGSSASNHVQGLLKNKLLLSSDLGSETRL